jgi:hypothetical protein
VLFVLVGAFDAGALAPRAINVYAFASGGCPHREKAVAFLRCNARPVAGVQLHVLGLTQSAGNRRLLESVMRQMGGANVGVPAVTIGGRLAGRLRR